MDPAVVKIETFQLIQDYVLRASKRPEVGQLVTGSRTRKLLEMES